MMKIGRWKVERERERREGVEMMNQSHYRRHQDDDEKVFTKNQT